MRRANERRDDCDIFRGAKMLRRIILLVSLFSACPLVPALAATPMSSYAATGPQTLVPYGWFDFCNRYKDECDASPLPAQDITLTNGALRRIEAVNEWVNRSVKPISDPDHWGLVDQWDYPIDGYGDCEDYALMKRKLLIEQGFPRQALLLTVVKDTHGEGHAILTIKTDRGDFILDNLNDEVKPWTHTGYRFVKRQSQSDPNVWVSIGEPTEEPAYVSR
jgi:predicted transglutaminase-like cysteine proteinase